MHIFAIIIFAIIVTVFLLGSIQLFIDIRENSKNNDSHVVSNDYNDMNKVNYERKIGNLIEHHSLLNKTFYNYNTNPEILITKPSLLDVNVFTTAKMVDDIVAANNFLNSRVLTNASSFIQNNNKKDIEDFIENFDYLVKNLQESMIQADIHASTLGVPGLSSDDKRIAKKSISIVLNDASTKEEKKTHWEHVVKIARKSNIDEQTISKVNSRMMDKIELGKAVSFKELI